MFFWLASLLAVFRPRSRHTADFLPKGVNDLALFELQTVTGEWLVPLPLDPAFPPSLFYRFERPSAEAYSRLVDRANKCTLLFGLYKDNFEEGSTENTAVPVQAVTILHGRHTTNAELVEFLKVRNLTTSTSKESLAVFAASQSVSYYGTPLSRGIAAPLRRPGQILDPLPDLLAERRPNSGILKNFSLSRLTHTVRTSMEPELALLMANLGVGTSPNNPTSILDPFMGAGIILLAAAMLFPECSMLGSDKNVDSTSADKILQNFAQFNRKPPVLIFQMQDVAQLDLAPSSLDCIVTDPPYDMKAKITGGGDFESAILLPLLRLASQSLKPNGRLVFYCPRAPPTTQQLETYGLDVVKIFEQRLSPTFSRFLCVIQNRD